MSQTLKVPDSLAGRLELVGRALHGTRWQRPLAAALGVSHVALSRWVRGGGTNIDVDAALFKLLRARAREIDAALLALLDFYKKR
ncbi:UNVERIFIED_ORG: transcriptional regulator with XRE-family HTH domain [Bradyrhizobium japonicum]|jgi:transcriptional regulator with XRE-family HTH domain|uniref:hypothetical protein n=1 Tax=Bradyrhizobium TaxID=374 RepID=UPI00347408E5